MNFGFSEEQDLLRSQVRRLLDQQSPLPVVRRIAGSPSGMSGALWKQLAELGLLGLLTPERDGGAGLGWVDQICVFEETGRSLLPGPLLAHTLVGSVLASFGAPEQQRRLLPRLSDGSAIATLALLEEEDWLDPDALRMGAERADGGLRLSGCKHFVPDGGVADHYLLAFRLDGVHRLAIVPSDAPGLAWEEAAPIDHTRRVGTLSLDGVALSEEALLPAKGREVLQAVLDRGAVAVSAETIGVCEAILDMTTQYAKDRIQFGSPIGRYQGVKHPLAELYADIECLKSLVYYAAWALDEEPEEVSLAAAKAKAWAAETVCRAGVTGIQLHGAVGYTEEYDIQLYLKRSKWARPAFGDEDHHYDRIARLGGL